MGNGIWDFFPHSRINPFIGGGVGVVVLDANAFGRFGNVPAGAAAIQTLTATDNKTVFAYQGLVGVSWEATDKISVDLYLSSPRHGE